MCKPGPAPPAAHPSRQLDPPDSEQLFLRGASLSFLFSQAWLLSPLNQGRYIHILRDLLEKVGAAAISRALRERLRVRS